MNPLVDAQARVRAVDEEIAAEARDWDEYAAYARRIGSERAAKIEEHTRAVRAAIEAREVPPPPPLEDPVLAEEHPHRLVTHTKRMEALHRRRHTAVLTAQAEIRADARAEYAAAIEEARPLVEALQGAPMERIRVAQEALEQVATARNVVTGARSHAEPPPRVDFDLLVQAVERGRDLLATEAPRVMVDRDGTGPRRLGMLGSNVNRPVESAPEPPLPPEPPR